MASIEAMQQQGFDRLLETRGMDFPHERPAVFSPAAAAMDPANLSATYFRWVPFFVPYEFSNWYEESRAHVDSCYIGDWSSIGKLKVRGPQALAFLSHIGMNNLNKFEVGQIKHHVQLDERGHVASEGIIYRTGDLDFLYTGGGVDWATWQFGLGAWQAELEVVTATRFIFEVQGPRSLHVLERATGENLRDLMFNRGRESRVGDVQVQLLRTGISGELGYELHGPVEDASRVWAAVVEAGAPLKICQLGMRSLLVQHIEAGIATAGIDYLPASIGTGGMPKLVPEGIPRGSFVPRGGLTDYFRYPFELGWGHPGRVGGHDFIGRDALLKAQADSGCRTLVNLEWSSEDVIDLFAARFDDGAPMPEPMEVPRFIGGSYDSVRVGGEEVGVSTSCTFSSALRKTISLCTISERFAAPGTEVTVLWGSQGWPQRDIRARVVAAPIRPDGRRVNVASLPALAGQVGR